MAGEELVNPERFWRAVEVAQPHECWPWKLYRIPRGDYGRMSQRVQGRRVDLYAHRIAWALNHGPIPLSMFVLHDCDNPPCCNPNHLFLGTHEENMRDMIAKGRRVKPSPRLTWGLASLIRTAYVEGATQKELSVRFGVSQTAISDVITGRTWQTGEWAAYRQELKSQGRIRPRIEK